MVANVHRLRERLAPGARLMAVVKADAYGHGAVPVARAALAGGAEWLGVAILQEALELRRGGIEAPLVVLGWTPPEHVRDVVAAGLEQTVFTLRDGEALASAAREAGRVARVHVKVDTGMSRLGFPAGSEAIDAVARLASTPGLELAGVFTHFACSDAADPTATRRQFRAFQEVLSALDAREVQVPLRHAANTAAILRFPETHLDLVRAGIGIYGYYPSAWVPRAGLEPALAWKTRVSQVRLLPAGAGVSYNHTYVARTPELLAVLPVGYADGYLRALSGRAEVLIRGRRARVRGRVCMDQTIVSAEGIPGIAPGDEVALMGRQGEDEITAGDLAAWADTISYEILCAISPRVPRRYPGV